MRHSFPFLYSVCTHRREEREGAMLLSLPSRVASHGRGFPSREVIGFFTSSSSSVVLLQSPQRGLSWERREREGATQSHAGQKRLFFVISGFPAAAAAEKGRSVQYIHKRRKRKACLLQVT